MDIMQQHYAEGGTVAAICAAPSVVLTLLPDLEGKKMTCYDGFEAELTAKGAEYVKEGVVTDGNMITGRGPGWAVEFGLAILAHVKGQETADKVKAGLML
jgi:4-methyl-5(b-hydroxyethyl)-thiazole monophosphate biosynthesis